MTGYLPFITRQWPLLAFGFCTVFWGNLGQSFFLSWYGADIQQTLSLSASRYGGIYALATVASGSCIMLMGGLLDKWRLGLFASLTALTLMLACVSLAYADSVMSLAVGFFLIRLSGQGLMPLTSQTAMARSFNENRGKAISIALSGVPAGEVIMPALAVSLIALLGWRQSWLIWALSIPLFYLPLTYWFLRRSKTNHKEKRTSADYSNPDKSAGRLAVLKDWRFWLTLPAVLSGPFMLTGIFIQQGFILAQKGWSPSWLAGSFVAYGILHWLSSMLSGVLVDSFSAKRLLPYIMLPLFLSLISLACLDGLWVAPLFMSFLGISIGMMNTVISALWSEVYGTTKQGAIRSMMMSLMVLASSVSPWLFGLLIDAGIDSFGLFIGSAIAVMLAGLLVLPAYSPIGFGRK